VACERSSHSQQCMRIWVRVTESQSDAPGCFNEVNIATAGRARGPHCPWLSFPKSERGNHHSYCINRLSRQTLRQDVSCYGASVWFRAWFPISLMNALDQYGHLCFLGRSTHHLCKSGWGSAVVLSFWLCIG